VVTVVTGGAGFLGSHLVKLLEAGGDDVVVIRSAETDLTDSAAVSRILALHKPDRIFHLAAEVGGIGANRDNPGRYWYANLMMGVNVLEQARIHKVKKVVMVGTICSYPKHAPVPFREETLWDGYPEETNAPYGVAKKALLVGSQAYRAQYGLNSIVLLPVNLYGPRDNFDLQSSHVIPALIRKMIEAQERGETSVTLWGDGTPTREFLYVDDCARGLVLAGRDYNDPEPINLGTGLEISIKDLAETIGKATGFDGEIIWDRTKPNGQPRRQLDVSRAKDRFGFEAEVSFSEGIERTVAWFRSNRT
jgi:GDP-L-fucose synthase